MSILEFFLEPILSAWDLWLRLLPLFIVLTIVFAIVTTIVRMVKDRKSA